MKQHVPDGLLIAGAIGQMFTAIVYPWVRHHVFDWYNDILKLKPLNQEIAKTYGYYIQGLNFSFGLITLLLLKEMQNGTGPVAALTGLIATYWMGKLITQFAYYPMYQIPDKWNYKLGEWLMNGLFLLFAIVYILVFVQNLTAVL